MDNIHPDDSRAPGSEPAPQSPVEHDASAIPAADEGVIASAAAPATSSAPWLSPSAPSGDVAAAVYGTPNPSASPVSTRPEAPSSIPDGAAPIGTYAAQPVTSATVTPGAPGAGMAVTALVFGIIAAVLALIPFVCFIAPLPAVTAVILGIIALVRRTTRRGTAITGLVLGGVALLMSFVMSIVSFGIVAAVGEDFSQGFSDGFNEALEEAGGTPQDVLLSGVGADEVPVTPIDGTGYYGVATITTVSDGPLIVLGLDESGAELERLVDGQGPYSGTVLWNTWSDSEVVTFQIVTSGAWTISLLSTDSVPEFDETNPLDGVGDTVVWYDGPMATGHLESGRDSSAWVWSPYSLEVDGMSCEIEPSSACDFEMESDGIFLQVYSYGDWQLSVGSGGAGI